MATDARESAIHAQGSDSRYDPKRVEALERVAAAAQKVMDTNRVLPQLVGPALYNELRDSLEATT